MTRRVGQGGIQRIRARRTGWGGLASAWSRLGRAAAALAVFGAASLPSLAAEPVTDRIAGSSPEPGPGTESIEIPGRPSTPQAAGGAPGLDDLLRLPSGFEAKEPGRPVAGASEEEWRRRFARAEKAIGEAQATLAETKQELDGLAGTGGSSQWSVAPPGASEQQSTSPLSFKLRQELARNREALDEAQRALRELKIEADLAGVPAEWRLVAGAPTAPPAPPAPQ